MTKRVIKKNIRKVMRRVTAEDIYNGALWYRKVYDETHHLAAYSGLQHRVVIDALAMLSPGIRWRTAIDSLGKLLKARREGSMESTVIPGYPRNVQKAKEILSGKAYHLSGPKVTAFADNIRNYEGNNFVTVDVHAYSVATGERLTIKEMPEITPKMYANISAAYIEVGEEFGLTGSQCQAVTWVWWRRNRVPKRYL